MNPPAEARRPFLTRAVAGVAAAAAAGSLPALIGCAPNEGQPENGEPDDGPPDDGPPDDGPPDDGPPDDEPEPTAAYGRFEGRLLLEELPDGRTMRLAEDFWYVDPADVIWDAPAGWEVDGASIPRAFWSIIGGPFSGRFRRASVVHDVACDRRDQDWRAVHRAFYDACLCGGVTKRKAWAMYQAVRNFGPRWEFLTTYANRPGVPNPPRSLPRDATPPQPTEAEATALFAQYLDGAPAE